jgi:long-chain fatty acid transport protein
VRLNERTAIGASLNWSNGETDDQSYSILASTSGQALSGLAGSGYSWRAGLLHRCDDATNLGIYYRSRSHLEVSGGTLRFAPGSQLPGQVVEGVGVSGAEFPEEYGIGVQHAFDCRFKGAAEYRRIKWADVRQNFTIEPPGFPAITFPQNWRDQSVYVLGAEFSPRGDGAEVWRAGFNYGRSPVPDDSLSPIFAATNELHYSLGYERALSDEWRMISGLSYSPANVQTSTAANPYNMTFGAGQPFSAGTPLWEFGVGFSWSPRQKAACCGDCGAREDCCCEVENAESVTVTEAKPADDPVAVPK